ncbi:MAG TPA: cupin domain-containing protein [Vicinamibacteria bacterium]|nr:cupin domain-containing protein [Vicinamibacteria bacterium]
MKQLAFTCTADAALLLLLGAGWLAAAPVDTPKPRVIPLEAAGRDHLALLQGPPETVFMRSGLVVLAPGKSVGKHSTKDNEEMLVILEGQGEMRFGGGDSLSFTKETALYCPPNTEHDVVNTGSSTLRYVYVVSRAVER